MRFDIPVNAFVIMQILHSQTQLAENLKHLILAEKGFRCRN